MDYDVIIIGAGASGVFASYEFTKMDTNAKILMIDSGNHINKRVCPISEGKVKNCIKCTPCNIMKGFGGAGSLSDGKYNITNNFGGDLYKHIGKNEALDYMEYVDKVLCDFDGQYVKLYSTSNSSIKTLAIKNDLISMEAINIRDYTLDKHRRVDDYPYGGGGGMLLTPQPIYDCYMDIKKHNKNTKLLFFSPKGRTLNNNMSYEYAKLDNITLLCGHYEGIDQRIVDMIVDEEISIGDYVLTGGELASLVFLDSVSRKISGVLSSSENVSDESFENNLLEYPQYTRPYDFMGVKVPDVLISGNHKKIDEWRKNKSLEETKEKRPDLIK